MTISGTPEAQWKAQFMLFRKVGYEGLTGPQEATLKVEIMVPSSQVGRIIGKGGSTVRELQRMTHAVIKLPEEGQNTASDETPVHIIGDFLSTQVSLLPSLPALTHSPSLSLPQAAQRQIRALVVRGSQPPGGARGGVARPPRPPNSVQPNHQQASVSSDGDGEAGSALAADPPPAGQPQQPYDSPSPTAAQSQ